MARSHVTLKLNPRVGTELHSAAAIALRKAGRQILDDAKSRVPVDTGKLRESGRLRVNSEQLTAEVRFTNPIATIVHEDLTAHHEQGQAKYLETALADRAGIQRTVERTMRAALQ